MDGAIRIGVALGLLALMCGAGEARSVSVDLGQTRVPPNVICDACMEFSVEGQMILSNPDFQKQAVDLISQMVCESLTTKLEAKCLDLVNVYVLDAFTALEAYLGPDFCFEKGLCVPEATSYIKPVRKYRVLLANAETCALCQEFANDAVFDPAANATKLRIIDALHLAFAGLEGISSSEQGDGLVDKYLMERLDDISSRPEELCEITHFCKPRSGKAAALYNSRGLKRNDCAICQFVVLELKLKLRDPATQERLLEVLLNGCNRVQNHVEECKMIVAQYGPFILENLDNILDADALCSRIGACESHKLSAADPVLVLGRAHHRVHFA